MTATPRPATKEQVLAAKQARDRERDEVFRQTGIRVLEDGRIVQELQQGRQS